MTKQEAARSWLKLHEEREASRLRKSQLDVRFLEEEETHHDREKEYIAVLAAGMTNGQYTTLFVLDGKAIQVSQIRRDSEASAECWNVEGF